MRQLDAMLQMNPPYWKDKILDKCYCATYVGMESLKTKERVGAIFLTGSLRNRHQCNKRLAAPVLA